MLSAIVQKVTGQTTLSYLRPRLFEPLGISGIDWEEDTRGINTGGWGLRLKTEDMAKFAQLFCKKENGKASRFYLQAGRRGQQHEDHAGPQCAAVKEGFQ